MFYLPFRCISEAKDCAKRLCRAFSFYLIRLSPTGDNETPVQITLQQTQHLLGITLGCAGWNDLSKRISVGGSTEYINLTQDSRGAKETIAMRMHTALGGHIDMERIEAAVSLSSLGQSPDFQSLSRKQLMHLSELTYLQWGELMSIQRWYGYHSRYNNRRSIFEQQMLLYTRDVGIAKVLGHPKPRKPRRPRAVTK